jgi:hypothetical protein
MLNGKGIGCPYYFLSKITVDKSTKLKHRLSIYAVDLLQRFYTSLYKMAGTIAVDIH